MSCLSPLTASTMPDEPLYRQVERYIEQIIRTGQLQPDDPLPSLSELSRKLGVNGLTVRRAIQELASRDVVVSHQGRGTFVSHGAVRRVLWISALNIFKGDVSPYYTDLLSAVQQVCADHGLRVEPVWIGESQVVEARQYLQPARMRCYQGYLFCGCTDAHPLLSFIAEARRPHVKISQTGSRAGWTVATDLRQSHQQAFATLAGRGCRQVAVFTVGHEQALAESARAYGLSLVTRVCAHDTNRLSHVERAGYRMADALLHEGAAVDGWYCCDDILARGVTRALLRHGFASSPPPIVVRSSRQHVLPLGLPIDYVVHDISEQAASAVSLLCDQLQSRAGATSHLCRYQVVSVTHDGVEQPGSCSGAARA